MSTTLRLRLHNTPEGLYFQQADFFAQQEEEARQAAIQAQEQQQWARQKASELRQQTQSQAGRQPLLKAHTTKSRQDTLIVQAFQDPGNPQQNILAQANGPERLPESKLRQLELNMDNLLAQWIITPSEYQGLAVAAKAAVAQNWLRQDGTPNSDDTVTYRGMSIEKHRAAVLAFADAERYWQTETHLNPQENWMKQLEKTASGLMKGLANGITAGAGPKVSAGEEGAYTTGDLIGAIGVNAAALLTGVFAPAVWAGYGAAREANREVDAGKPLNPAAIAASGAISSIPGTAAIKVPIGVAGKVGTGLATGYATDMANQGVQQLGDTGRINPSHLDYRPGLGTLAGGTTGLLSHPAVSQAFQKYLLVRQAQILAGEKVPVSLEDFLLKIQAEAGWTDQELAFYMGQSSVPPVGSRYDRAFWSWGYNPKENKPASPVINAFRHSNDHAKEFGLPKGDPYYIELADDTIPPGAHVNVTDEGKQYFYDDTTDILYIREADNTPKSMFKPGRGNVEKGWIYFKKQTGTYKGQLP